MCLNADPGVASPSQAPSPTFLEINLEIISTAILLTSADQKGCCQLQVKVCAQSISILLRQACLGKKVWLGELIVPT